MHRYLKKLSAGSVAQDPLVFQSLQSGRAIRKYFLNPRLGDENLARDGSVIGPVYYSITVFNKKGETK